MIKSVMGRVMQTGPFTTAAPHNYFPDLDCKTQVVLADDTCGPVQTRLHESVMSTTLSILLDDEGVALARTPVTIHYMFRFVTLVKKIQRRDKARTW